jgi:hypothetical protein
MRPARTAILLYSAINLVLHPRIELSSAAYKTAASPFMLVELIYRGGEYRIRTDHPLLAKQMLSQMS